MTKKLSALVVGATGIVGRNLCERLLADGWTVYGLARRPELAPYGTIPLVADLNDREAVSSALSRANGTTHVFQTSWTPAPTEDEACIINAAHLSNVLDGAREAKHALTHVALVTGVKHYLGPFADFGRYLPETPFLEEAPRLPIPNFYYAQEDVLFASSERDGFTWSVHRPNTIVGFAVGSLMNQGMTLACYASICRETGRPFLFPGVPEQWEMLTEISDARLVAEQVAWASLTPGATNLAFNTGNGDVFRWKRMWTTIARHFGLDAVPYEGNQVSLEASMADADAIWRRMAVKYDLVEADITRLATWWHIDADFGRKVECISDMSQSRKSGFMGYRSSTDSFLDLFRRLEEERIIPVFADG